MEMNTRLQVEHPVTEMVTQIDLVEWQLRVAAGEKLPKTQDEIALDGHAFEARIYAEDPAKGFLPATGTLHHLSFPEADSRAVRVETGVRAGDRISPYYDPMIAKLVVHGADRETALAGLAEALRRTEIAGSVTNLAFLSALAADPDFAAGDVDTGLIARKPALTAVAAAPDQRSLALAAAAAADNRGATAPSHDPWAELPSYGHFHPLPRKVELGFGEQSMPAAVVLRADGRAEVLLAGDERPMLVGPGEARVAKWPGHLALFSEAGSFTFSVSDPFERSADAAASADAIRAPMPGLVKLVRVQKGDAVIKGQPLLVLEAMKMEHGIGAPHDAVVAEIVGEGRQVTDGDVLVRFEATPAKPSSD